MLWPTSSDFHQQVNNENLYYYHNGVKYRQVYGSYCTTTGRQGISIRNEVVQEPITHCPYCNKTNFVKITHTGSKFCRHCRRFLSID